MPFNNRNRNRRKARNEKVADAARRKLENLAATHQASNMSALKVDGHPCLLYVPLTTGRHCTCATHTPILDEDGHLSSDTMNQILGADVEVYEYDNGPTDVPNVKLDEDTFEDETNEAWPHEPIDLERNPGGSNKACNVCLGNRFVGGFKLHGGNRIILDASLQPRSHLAQLNTLVQPYAYEVSEGGWVEFDVLIPRAMTRLDAFRLWNNMELMRSYTVTLDGTVVTASTILQHANLGKPQVFRITATKDIKLTHFELQVGGSELIYVDVSQYRNTTQLTLYRQKGEFTAVLPPTFTQDLKGAIVEDTTDDLRFRITEMARNSDHASNHLHNECQMRVVQPYELANLLPTLDKAGHRAAQRLTNPAPRMRIL